MFDTFKLKFNCFNALNCVLLTRETRFAVAGEIKTRFPDTGGVVGARRLPARIFPTLGDTVHFDNRRNGDGR